MSWLSRYLSDPDDVPVTSADWFMDGARMLTEISRDHNGWQASGWYCCPLERGPMHRTWSPGGIRTDTLRPLARCYWCDGLTYPCTSWRATGLLPRVSRLRSDAPASWVNGNGAGDPEGAELVRLRVAGIIDGTPWQARVPNRDGPEVLVVAAYRRPLHLTAVCILCGSPHPCQHVFTVVEFMRPRLIHFARRPVGRSFGWDADLDALCETGQTPSAPRKYPRPWCPVPGTKGMLAPIRADEDEDDAAARWHIRWACCKDARPGPETYPAAVARFRFDTHPRVYKNKIINGRPLRQPIHQRPPILRGLLRRGVRDLCESRGWNFSEDDQADILQDALVRLLVNHPEPRTRRREDRPKVWIRYLRGREDWTGGAVHHAAVDRIRRRTMSKACPACDGTGRGPTSLRPFTRTCLRSEVSGAGVVGWVHDPSRRYWEYDQEGAECYEKNEPGRCTWPWRRPYDVQRTHKEYKTDCPFCAGKGRIYDQREPNYNTNQPEEMALTADTWPELSGTIARREANRYLGWGKDEDEPTDQTGES